MIINSFNFGTTIEPIGPFPHLYLLTRFNLADGEADGSQVIEDSASRGNVWTCSPTVHLSTSDALTGTASLVSSAPHTNFHEYARVTWPVGLSLSGEFSVEFTWRTPIYLTIGYKYVLLSSSIAENDPETPNTTPYGSPTLIVLYDQGYLQFYTGIYGSSDTRISFITGLLPETTYKILITRDSQYNVRCFIDGAEDASGAVTCVHDFTNAGHFIRIGRTAWPDNSLYNFGVLDELRITDKCLAVSSYSYTPGPIPLGEPVVINT
jgi:hypothetical protein